MGGADERDDEQNSSPFPSREGVGGGPLGSRDSRITPSPPRAASLMLGVAAPPARGGAVVSHCCGLADFDFVRGLPE
jgi:hypothetical protein